MYTDSFSSAEMVGFFAPVITEIIRQINMQVTAQTKAIVLPGGFGQSPYLCEILENYYGRNIQILSRGDGVTGLLHGVARGALLRYEDVDTSVLPSKVSFGIGRAESWNPDHHPDATIRQGQRANSGRIVRLGSRPDYRIVEMDPYDDTRIVYERWQPILKKGAKLDDRSTHTTTWQQYMVPIERSTIRVQIYYTELDISAHDPVLTGSKRSNSDLREGIEEWGRPLETTLPHMGALGFHHLKTRDAGRVWEFYCRLVLECSGANIKVKWQIAHANTQPFDEEGRTVESHRLRFTQARYFEVFDETFSPFARV